MIKFVIKKAFEKFGYRLKKIQNELTLPIDMDDDFLPVFRKYRPFTMTAISRMYAQYKAVKYIISAQIPGSMVECGVWKGGTMMMTASEMLKLGELKRKIYLYDTYEGMAEPTERDVLSSGLIAKKEWKKNQREDHNEWMYAPLDEVKENLRTTGYPQENLIYVKGKVEQTIPANVPEEISLLCMDMDMYEPTKHALRHLFPRLSPNGVIIFDDYGSWHGERDAVNEYIKENDIKILLHRISGERRIGIKI